MCKPPSLLLLPCICSLPPPSPPYAASLLPPHQASVQHSIGVGRALGHLRECTQDCTLNAYESGYEGQLVLTQTEERHKGVL